MNVLDQLIAARAGLPAYDPELWLREYEFNPYLATASNEELSARAAALANNLVFLLDDARDAVPAHVVYHSSWWWLKKYELTLNELRRRGLPMPIIPALSAPASSPWRTRPGQFDYVIRYGDQSWLRPMIESGSVRISPASRYGASELTDARRDNEQEKIALLSRDNVRITTQDGRTTRPLSDVRRSVSTTANYYLLCASGEFDQRLFPLFPDTAGNPANSCVVIWDVDEFAARLERAAKAVLPGWLFHHNPVNYYDPREPTMKQYISAGTSKDFSYAYQREYRFLWMPVSGGNASSYIELTLGPLDDIAGLYSPAGELFAGSPRITAHL